MKTVRFLPVCLLAAVLFMCAGSAAAQPNAVLQPKENLVVEGIPSIPATLADEVRRYTEYRTAAATDWHPTRREILISTRFGNTAQIHRVQVPGGARHQLTFFNEPVGSALYEPNEGKYFLFTRDTGGNEFAQIYRYDLTDGHVTLLTDGKRSQNGGIEWSRKGDRIAYGSTRRNGADRDLYVMNPADTSTNRLVMRVNGGGWGVSDWSPDDRQWLVSQGLSVNESRIWLVDVASGEKTILTDTLGVNVAYQGARFSKDGKGVYLTTDFDNEYQRLSYLDLASRKITPLVDHIEWDVDEFEPSPDRTKLVFVTNEAGLSRLYLYDVATRAVRPVGELPPAIVGGFKWRPDGQEIGFTMSSATAPSDVYSIEVSTGRLNRWTESELGGIAAADLKAPELVRWNSFDGREITGFLYQPPARFTGKRPVIINIHGGPEGQSRPGFLGRNQFFVNELGVAMIFPNVRGSTGYGKTFVTLDNGKKREDSVKDIGALLDWIASRPDLDASRVMVTGGSYGGYMTLAVATSYNDRICCSLDVVGISNFNTFLKNTESYRRDLRRVEYGDERDPEMQAFFEQIAPLNRAANITKPLFVVQGGNDPRVPLSEAEQMVERVRKNDTPVWYLMARDEGHGFRKKENADFQFYATVLFVRQYLLAPSGPVQSTF